MSISQGYMIQMVDDFRKAQLVLEDGSVFEGRSFGFEASCGGEVVFNTGMVGYPEALTDPSYHGQILVLTYPLIGNYGVPAPLLENGVCSNFESSRIQVQGLVVSEYSFQHSHWKAKKSLSDWLKENKVPGLFGIDTRALTKKLREKGVMLGKIIFDEEKGGFEDPNERNLAAEVSVTEPQEYGNSGRKILLVDCGMKNSILRNFLKRGVKVKRVPWDYDFKGERFEGLVISNGPGDPKMIKETIKQVEWALEEGIPTFGICLGSQILALAGGADTYKLKFGHRSQNQPCIEVGTKRCFITSQNHGYAVASESLGKEWVPWFENANDKTNEGVKHKSLPFMAVQFHPEVHPGPFDTEYLFDYFLKQVRREG